MFIRRATEWLFGLGDDRELAAPESRGAADSPDDSPNGAAEDHRYGEAEAIRVLYQAAFLDAPAPKPPRPRGRRGRWLARTLNWLSPVLHAPAGAKA